MQKKTQFSLWYLLFALFAIFTLHDVWTQMRTIEPLPYSEFQRLLKTGELSEISITDNTIQGTFKKPLEDGRQKFVTTRVDPALAKDLAEYGIRVNGVSPGTIDTAFHSATKREVLESWKDYRGYKAEELKAIDEREQKKLIGSTV